jgi:hypothetical protein
MCSFARQLTSKRKTLLSQQGVVERAGSRVFVCGDHSIEIAPGNARLGGAGVPLRPCYGGTDASAFDQCAGLAVEWRNADGLRVQCGRRSSRPERGGSERGQMVDRLGRDGADVRRRRQSGRSLAVCGRCFELGLGHLHGERDSLRSARHRCAAGGDGDGAGERRRPRRHRSVPAAGHAEGLLAPHLWLPLIHHEYAGWRHVVVGRRGVPNHGHHGISLLHVYRHFYSSGASREHGAGNVFG